MNWFENIITGGANKAVASFIVPAAGGFILDLLQSGGISGDMTVKGLVAGLIAHIATYAVRNR